MTIRLAESTDALGVVDLVRSCFTPALIERSIYGCAGVERFIERQLAVTPLLRPGVQVVCADGDHIGGYCELAASEEGVILNYIAVAASQRGRRLGARLFLDALQKASLPHTATVELDVLVGNPARRWYESMGFVAFGQQRWLDIEDWTNTSGAAGTVLDYPQAAACHRAYGFSQIRVAADCGVCIVGQLGVRWFRLTDPRLLDDARVLATLTEIDDSRTLLVLGSPSCQPIPIGAISLIEMVRMTCAVGFARRWLASSVAAREEP